MLNIFNKKKTEAPALAANAATPAPVQNQNQNQLADIVLNNIHDGVIIVNPNGVIEFINPAAVVMTDCKDPSNAIGLDYALLMKLKTKDGRELTPEENPLFRATATNQPLEGYACLLISGNSAKDIPVSITMLPVNGGQKIITFRNIEKELAEESEQTEFISTASHEMRTPVATIDGYLALCLNPQTATIDERAKGYLDSAKKASEHLGKLFQDLLDVTKLDDGRIRPEFVPAEMMSFIKQIATDHAAKAQEKKINYSFGTNEPVPQDEHRLEQVVYASIDPNFMREIMDNLIDNAIKYTPSGGSIYINVLGDGDRVLINVTDTGIGISAEDLQHVFQKFYRADNSDTREIGGTGLGLYLVKQRTEAMGGRVWAESAFGQGTTFYVSLPRITAEEYNKRMIAVQNAQMVNNNEGGNNEQNNGS
ncbi:MAG: PAS domain-containing sensor histidine kinase [Candidatus Saccharibacteria bacterium]|nr:PAS domain-containing sensor histidine kinase [Candidatus Saccharibacteria bacterium]